VGLDPSLLVQGAGRAPDRHICLDARLEPQVSGDLDFELVESAALGRPLAGRGTASLSPSQQLAVDVDLTVRSARLRASGGLGAPGRNLVVDIDAPALDELTLPVKGGLTAHATLSGDWRAPAVEARLQATKLVYGAQGIDDMRATLSLRGRVGRRVFLARRRHWAPMGREPCSVGACGDTFGGRYAERASLSLQASYEEDQTAHLAARADGRRDCGADN